MLQIGTNNQNYILEIIALLRTSTKELPYKIVLLDAFTNTSHLKLDIHQFF